MKFYFDNKKLFDSVKYKQVFKDRIKGVELCEKINVSRSTLHRVKEGRKIDMETFLKLCNYTDVEPAVFFVTNKNK